MNEIPTAEKFLLDFELGDTGKVDIEDAKEALVEFTKLHVQAALEAAADNAEAKQDHSDYGTGSIWVDKKSILNAYPSSLIQ